MLNLDELNPRRHDPKKIALWKYQRATRGVCDYDVWNLDGYLLELIPQALRLLAETTHSYPGSPDFPRFEDWQKWLCDTADLADRIDELRNGHNPDMTWEQAKDLDRHIDELKNELFDRLKEQFFHLWD